MDKALKAPPSERTELLAPLDNLLWDRKLIRALFDFDYTWEVYKPREQRKYGYYVLPVLRGNKLAARVEPVIDAKARRLRILNVWWEHAPSPEMKRDLRDCVERFADYHGASEYTIENE
jgi:uncharacterized protein YcaQ